MQLSSRDIQGSRRLSSKALAVIKIGVILFILISIIILEMIILFSPKSPPEMNSIHNTVKSIDFSDLPSYSHFTARDGTQLAYRFYAGSPNKVAILIHGSSGSSRNMHVLGKALSKNGVTAFALDVRGHGDSGNRGDINYVGQLEDDLADFVTFIRSDYPNAPITLVGHSSGGGFTLRVAGSSISNLFDQYILLAPYLNYNSPTVRPENGGWANPSIPRYAGITILNQLGIHSFDSLPVVAFAVPDNLTILTKYYSYRLLRNFGANDNYINDDYLDNFRNCSVPITIIVGSDDEILYADKYTPEIRSVSDNVAVEVVPSVNHMAIVSNETALKAVVYKF